LLFDCHSCGVAPAGRQSGGPVGQSSEIPRSFPGTLPLLNERNVMKILRFLLGAVLLPVGLAISAAAAEPKAKESAPKPGLLISVQSPFVFDSFVRDDVEEALYYHLSRALTVKDRALVVAPLKGDDKSAGEPVLKVSLVKWRTNRIGDIECLLRAELETADGVQPLGIFLGSASAITRTRGFLGRDFERAAEDASRQLSNVLRDRGLI